MEMIKRKAWLVFCVVIALIFTTAIDVCGFTLDCSLDIPMENTVKKPINALIAMSGDGDESIGVTMVNITYDSTVMKFTSATLAAGDTGNIDTYAQENTVKIIYLNPSGKSITTGNSPLVNLKFTALDTPVKTLITVSASDSVAVNESQLSSRNPMEYEIEITEKEVTSTGSATGTRAENNVSSSSASKSKATSKASSKSSSAKALSPDKESQDQEDSLLSQLFGGGDDSGIASLFGNNIWYFVIGGGCVVAIGTLMLVAYKLGMKKKKATLSSDKNTDENIKESMDIDGSE